MRLFEAEQRCAVFNSIFEVGEEAFVGQVERVRVLPVVPHHFLQAIHDVVVVHLERQLASSVQASRREVDRADERRDAIGQQHLPVQLEMPEFVHFDPEIVENPQPADALHELVAFERVRRPRHHVDLHTASSRLNQALDDHRILVPLVLDEELVLRFVDEPAVRSRPGPGHQMR